MRDPDRTTIGFVGLGNMGGNMAARLLAAGYPVSGWQRSREHARQLIEQGLEWRETPCALADRADVVVTSLPDDAVLDEVATGADGILAGLGDDKIWIDMSTISPEKSKELATRARAQGAWMLDAPVSGSVPQVQAGTLTIMVGGDEGAYRRVEPLLRELGTPNYIGSNGQGLALKLAINISLAVQMLAFAEGLLLAERSGIDRQRALDVMEESPIGSPMLRARASIILEPPAEAWFDLRFMHKDIKLALDAARSLGIPLPTAERADEVLEQAVALGYERRDLAALFQALEDIAAGDS
jgi:3-hydroxyisobutyrate dehydrogenase-like beta-hydroxyacid dehydrogenase